MSADLKAQTKTEDQDAYQTSPPIICMEEENDFSADVSSNVEDQQQI